MYLLAPFILENFKKILRAIPDLLGCAIFGNKMAHLSWTIFFGKNHYYYFHLSTDPFHCPKFKKILIADPELWGCANFGPKMVHLPQGNFFWENYQYYSLLPISPFHCANDFFFFFSKNLLMSRVSFIHAYLHAKNKTQILIY